MNVSPYLPELRRQYKMDGAGCLSVKPSEAQCGNESLHYWWDHQEHKHGFHSMRDGSDRLVNGYYVDEGKIDLCGEVALTNKGRRAVGQHRRKDGVHELLELPLRKPLGFLQRWGWVAPRAVMELPKKCKAFDVGPRGQIAAVFDNEVHVGTPEQGLTPWKTFSTTVRDVHYLADGTLSVALSGGWTAQTYVFELHSPGGEQGRVDFKTLHPEAYYHHGLRQLERLSFLAKDLSPEAARACVDNLEWLRADSGSFESHRHLGGADVLTAGARPTLWQVDPQTGQATRECPLELPEGLSLDFGKPMHALSDHLVLADGTAAVWEKATGKLLGLLPEVSKLDTRQGLIAFVDREGQPHTLHPGQVPGCKNEPWYRRTLHGQVLGAVPESLSGVRLEGAHVNVGGTKIRIRAAR